MSDDLMRRLWVSPWTPLLFALLCGLGEGNRMWVGPQFWICFGGSVYGFALFFHRGRKRWGKG